ETRRFLLTDMDSWHWENLALPAGVRLAPFQQTVPTGEPLAAVARIGPDGLEGRIAAGSFQNLTDVLLSTPHGRRMALRLQPDGAFSAGTGDILPAGAFLAGGVLSDRQQRRRDIYKQFLKRTAVGPESPNVVLAWADPIDMRFTLLSDVRAVGDALLVIPLRLQRSTPGERVTIPGPLVS